MGFPLDAADVAAMPSAAEYSNTVNVGRIERNQHAQSAGPPVGWRGNERILTNACREEGEDDHSLRVPAEPEQGHVGLVLVAGFESGARDAHSLDTSDDPDNAETD